MIIIGTRQIRQPSIEIPGQLSGVTATCGIARVFCISSPIMLFDVTYVST